MPAWVATIRQGMMTYGKGLQFAISWRWVAGQLGIDNPKVSGRVSCLHKVCILMEDKVSPPSIEKKSAERVIFCVGAGCCFILLTHSKSNHLTNLVIFLCLYHKKSTDLERLLSIVIHRIVLRFQVLFLQVFSILKPHLQRVF